MPTGHYQRKPLSDATKAKISARLTGIKRTPETLEKMRRLKNYWKGGIRKQPGYMREYAARNRERDREKRRTIRNRYRARKANAPGSHTVREWRELKAMHAHLCAGCGDIEPNVKLTVDHIIPLSLGGSDDISNIQPLCKPCNSRKQAKTEAILV